MAAAAVSSSLVMWSFAITGLGSRDGGARGSVERALFGLRLKRCKYEVMTCHAAVGGTLDSPRCLVTRECGTRPVKS